VSFDLAQADQGDQFIGTESSCAICTVEDSGDEFSFIFVEGEDLLFDGIFGDQSINGHGAELAESVGSVGRAAVRFRPVPPALREIRNRSPCPAWKASTAS